MSPSRRPATVATVVTVTIAAAAVVSAALVMRWQAPQASTQSDGHAAVINGTQRSTTTSAPRGPRVIPPIFGILFALAAGVLTHVGIVDGLVGRARRRIGDVGESWRALLLGAPPVRA